MINSWLLRRLFLTVLAVVICLPPLVVAAGAEVVQSQPQPMGLQTAAPVIITELQTGSSPSGKSDEFVELYNASERTVDISGWQLRYLNASNETATATILSAAAPDGGETEVVLEPHSYYLFRTAPVAVPDVPGWQYDAKLSNADKAVWLLRPDHLACMYSLEDSVAWGASSKGEGQPPQVPAADKNSERHLERYHDQHGFYLDTNNNQYDFKITAAVSGSPPMASIAQGATPGGDNLAAKVVEQTQAPALPPALPAPLAVPDCELPPQSEEPDVPSGPPVTIEPVAEPPVAASAKAYAAAEETLPPDANTGLASLQFTEALPNPAPPQSDASDEFIELYNSNGQAFDLSGYSLMVSKKHYNFPAGTLVPPRSFRAFFSAETKLSLANNGGTASLADPKGNIIASLEPYTLAKDGLAWARADGKWSWTAAPTPNAANVMSVPAAKTKNKSTDSAAPTKDRSTPGSMPDAAKPGQADTSATSVASLAPETPLHGSVLVLVGVFAVLYGVYEYRHDVGNYLYRLRSYRTSRAKARCRAEGRGGDRAG